MADYSHLKRIRLEMAEEVKEALEGRGLMAAYLERPAYQQNDYLSWINRSVRLETRKKRLRQMLDELESGGVYMGMIHKPSQK